MRYIQTIVILIGVLIGVNFVFGAISDVNKTDLNFKVNQGRQFSSSEKQFYGEIK